MADLKERASDVLSRILPLFQSTSITPAQKDEAQGIIQSFLREMGQRALCEQMLSVKERFQEMLSVLERIQCELSDSSFQAPRPKTGK